MDTYVKFAATVFLLVGGFIHNSEGNFHCQNGKIISNQKFCDGVQDCDGSDEIYANDSCPLCKDPIISCRQPQQANRSCEIHRNYLCNASVSCIGLTPCDVGCPTYYRCSKTNQCVLRKTVCDGDPCNGCPEDDTDWKTGIGFQCARSGQYCQLPQQLLWDSVQDCADGADLCYKTRSVNDGRDQRAAAGSVFDDKRCFMCYDGSMMVPRHKVCDGTIDCADMSDECLCEKRNASICDKVLHSSTQACDKGQVVCPMWTNGNNFTKCLNRTMFCDGLVDCPSNNMDERYSYCKGTLPCPHGLLSDAGSKCRCTQNTCSSFTAVGVIWPISESATLCNGVTECRLEPMVSWSNPPGYPEDECLARCPPGTFGCTDRSINGVSVNPPVVARCQTYLRNFTMTITLDYYKQWCNGIVDCLVDKSDETGCNRRFYCKSGPRINIPLSEVCDGTTNCDKGEDENPALCPERFYCPTLDNTKVSVPKKSYCNFIIDCDDKSDESNCTDGRFYCENADPLYVLAKDVLNGRGDCSDWSDECSTHLKTDANILSSRYEMIANPFLRAIVWIMAMLALIGNSVVVVGEIKVLKRILQTGGTASLRTNHMLVLNLAVGDLLMGIYLLMLGIAGAAYSGIYCSQSYSWLTSQTCKLMGVLVVLSSQTSVLSMVLLTISRLYAVYNPIKAISKPKKRFVVLAILLIWTISLTLALVPLTSYHNSSFSKQALIKGNPHFSNVVVDFDASKNFTLELLTYSPQFQHLPASTVEKVQATTSWNELQEFVETHAPGQRYLDIENYFGYYSESSVCIPNLFVTKNYGAWRFSIAISTINFLSFIFVATGYIVIIIKAKKSVGASKRPDKKSAEMQRKIIRLIATDFCCWIPLSIMVFVNFSGVKIDSISYAVSAIVLLPINSALNPILYSSFVDKFVDKIRGRTPAPSISSSSTRMTTMRKENQL